MANQSRPRVVAPLCALAAASFAIATAFWFASGDPLFTQVNAFWAVVLSVVALLAYRSPSLEKRLEQSFLGRAYRFLRPAFPFLGPLIGMGYALVAAFWWGRHAYFWVVVNGAWGLSFAALGILSWLRGLRCALAMTCFAAGGLYMVTATWWFTEGRELSPERNTRFFCYNLLWCAVLIAAGLIIDRSRSVPRSPTASE